MAQRSFTDPKGVRWEVWEVHPQLSERRLHPRRFVNRGRVIGHDRRARVDRRNGDAPGARARIADGFEQGWLVFQAPQEKRRLAPIPSDWERSSDMTLLEMCGRAHSAGEPRRGRLIE